MKLRVLIAISALGLVVCSTGCQTVAYQSSERGAYRLARTFPYNTWETLVKKPIAETHKAVERGLEDLEIKPITSQVDKIAGTVDALFADHMDLEITLEAVSAELTRVRIRCGLHGDRERSVRLFEAIEKHF